MTATTKTALGPSTLNRKWFVDLNTGDDTTPVWIPLLGMTEVKPVVEGSMQDDSDFDGGGWGSNMNSLNRWKVEGKFRRAPQPGSTPPVYDPGQEVLREAGGSTGIENVVHCRWYEMEPNGPRVEAYDGFAAVTYTEDGGGVEALSFVSFVLDGRGARNDIPHPATTV
jgi:hypothetical protein